MKNCAAVISLLLSAIGIAQNLPSSEAQFEIQANGRTYIEDPNSLDGKLQTAIEKTNLRSVKALLKSGANPNSTYANGWPLIFDALSRTEKPGGLEILAALIDSGANVNAVQPDQGWTPLHNAVATMIGPENAVQLLIKHGAKVDGQMPGAGTPLHMAANWGRLEFVKLLVASGANLEAKTELDPKTSYVPADSASVFKSKDGTPLDGRGVLDEFYEPGYDQVGQTPLIRGAQSTDQDTAVKTAEFLLDSGAKIDATDSIGRTALHEAVQAENDRLTELLVRRGATINARTKNGFTPLHIAVRFSPYGGISDVCAKILLDHGADPNATTNAGLTPLKMSEDSYRLLSTALDSVAVDAEYKKETRKNLDSKLARIKELLRQHGAKEQSGQNSMVWLIGSGIAILTVVVVTAVIWKRRTPG